MTSRMYRHGCYNTISMSKSQRDEFIDHKEVEVVALADVEVPPSHVLR